jgi:hypothetical protein
VHKKIKYTALICLLKIPLHILAILSASLFRDTTTIFDPEKITYRNIEEATKKLSVIPTYQKR